MNFFIPENARPPVLQKLADDAWKVAAELERLVLEGENSDDMDLPEPLRLS
jgi:hypothetical protein